MRLINARTHELVDCTLKRPVPKPEDEVLFSDMPLGTWTQRKAWPKIVNTGRLALDYDVEFAWIDTCCIDKSSSAELSEAINSMFKWYKEAKVCFAFLSDVKHEGALVNMMSSRWWKRGWTLQELIAPSNVWFFDADHKKIGARNNAEIASRTSNMTTIDYGLLTHADNVHLRDYSIAFRMSWASTRSTTRIEDEAYSLLGIFDVNIPLLYGEGRKAFR